MVDSSFRLWPKRALLKILYLDEPSSPFSYVLEELKLDKRNVWRILKLAFLAFDIKLSILPKKTIEPDEKRSTLRDHSYELDRATHSTRALVDPITLPIFAAISATLLHPPSNTAP